MSVEKGELQGVLWVLTAQLALARGFIAGCIWSIVVLFYSDETTFQTILNIFILTIGMPFSYVILRLLNVILGWLAIYAVILNLVSKVYSLAICVADPVIYFINRRFPHIFNVPHFGIFNFFMLILVKDPEAMG